MTSIIDIADQVTVAHHPTLLPAPVIMIPLFAASRWTDDEGVAPDLQEFPPILRLVVRDHRGLDVNVIEVPVPNWGPDATTRTVVPLMGTPVAIEGRYDVVQQVRRHEGAWGRELVTDFSVRYQPLVFPGVNVEEGAGTEAPTEP